MSRGVLIAGCGYVGSALAARMVAGGTPVWGLRRNPEGLPDGVRPVAADVEDAVGLRDALARAGLPERLDGAVYAVSANERSDDGYRRAYVEGPANLLRALEGVDAAVGRLLFVSSTAVYGAESARRRAAAEGGPEAGWVDEATSEAPDDFRGERLLEGERRCLAGPFPAVVLRLAGIYGPGRTRLIDSVRRGEARCTAGDPVWTNRIHRDDCAGAIEHLLGLSDPEAVYIGVDDEPADRCEVLRWLARRLNVPDPEVAAVDEPGARRGGSKRCSNRRLVGSGYRMIYPSFREGYGAMVPG